MQLRKLEMERQAALKPPTPPPAAVATRKVPTTRGELDSAFAEFIKSKGVEGRKHGGDDYDAEPDGGESDDAGFGDEDLAALLDADPVPRPLTPIRSVISSDAALAAGAKQRLPTAAAPAEYLPEPRTTVSKSRGPVVKIPAKPQPAAKVKPFVLDVPTTQPIPMKLVKPKKRTAPARAPVAELDPDFGGDHFNPEEYLDAMDGQLTDVEDEADAAIDQEVMETNQLFVCRAMKQMYFMGAQYIEDKSPARFEGLGSAVKNNPVNAIYWDAGISEACSDLGIPLHKLKSYHFLFLGNALVLAPYLFSKKAPA